MNYEFGGRLLKIIPDNDLAEFAKQIGVKYETVRVWCKNKNLPNGTQLIKINEKYKVDLHWLLVGKEFKGNNIAIEKYNELKQKHMDLMEEHLRYVKENQKLKDSLKTFLKIWIDTPSPTGVERRSCRIKYDKYFKEADIASLIPSL